MALPTFGSELARPVAAVVATTFTVIAGFLAFWASGGSWGLCAHWGGAYTVLPAGLRAMDAVSAALFLAGALVVLGRAGYWESGVPIGVLHCGIWAFIVILTLSALMNFASSSRWERFMLGPLAFVLASLCFVVARSPEEAGA